MPDLKPEELKRLLTAAELKLVLSSQQPALAKLSETKLKKQIDLTRQARDKWRDQATRQRRQAQRAQGSRTTDAATRSASKSEILTQALNALQSQADKIGAGTVTPGRKLPAAKAPSKQKRAQVHRASRAEVRASLEEKRTSISASTTKKKVAKKKSTATQGTGSKKKSAEGAVKKTAHKQATKKKASKKKVSGKKKAAGTSLNTKSTSSKSKTAKRKGSTGDPLKAARLNVNPSDQRASRTKAKKARIQQSGLTTRSRGHVSARGKRAQGRRDRQG